MTGTTRFALAGGIIAAAGLVVCLYAYFLVPPYAGASGAGMAGLGSAFAMIGGMLAIGIGLLVALGALLWKFIRTRRATGRH